MDGLNDIKKRLLSFIENTFSEIGQRVDQEHNAFKPSMVPHYVPSHEIVKPGIYASKDECVHVEVLKQDRTTGLIHLLVYDEDDPYKKCDFISTGMFIRLFKTINPKDYVLKPNSTDGC